MLRQTREGLGWDIRDVGAALRIRPDYLEALERNSVAGLPGPTYATGFLRAYAEYLGLDGAELVRRFRDEKTGLHAKAELAFPVPLTDRGIPGGGLFLIAILLCVLGYGTWYYVSSGTHGAPPSVEPVPTRMLPPPTIEPPTLHPTTPSTAADAGAQPAPITGATPAPPAIPSTVPHPAVVTAAPAPVPTPLPSATPTPDATQAGAATPGPDAAKPDQHVFGNPDAHGRVVLKATATTWITVKDGPKVVLNRLLKKGDVYYTEKDDLTMRIGSAGALQVEVDGKQLPPIGETGQVKTMSLRPERLLNPPTPTPAPSPNAASEPAATQAH